LRTMRASGRLSLALSILLFLRRGVGGILQQMCCKLLN
jgi:hypothetical protein